MKNNPQNKRLNRKAQLQIGETTLVLVIFFILLTIGLIFYSKYQEMSLKNLQEIDGERSLMKYAISITYFPELSCTSLVGEIKEGCFDIYKIAAFSDLMADDDFKRDMTLAYFDVFGDSTIIVQELFPTQNEYVLFNRTIAGAKSVKRFFIPVIIRNDLLNTDAFAYLEISTYK